MIEVLKKYSNVVVLCHDEVDKFNNLEQDFGNRCFNFGLGAQNLVSAAAGFVVRGKMPIVVLPVFALSEVYGQLLEDICRPNLNVKFMVVGGDEAGVELLKILPNMESAKALEDLVKSYGPAYLILA